MLFIDLNLPDGSGLDLLEEMETIPETVLITGQASIETAVQALRRGVADYLTKPVDFARVKMVLANVSRTRELKEEIGGLRGELRKLGRFGALIGAAPAMQKVYDLIGKGRQDRRDDPHHRRDGNRQGGGGPDHPPAEPAQAASRSCPSTAAPSRRTSSRASCSATSEAASPAPTGSTRATSSGPTAARCSSTRSRRCRSSSR